jgi:Bacterial Ig domain
MKRIAAVAVALAALAVAGLDARPSGADFLGVSANRHDVFGAATDFNTVTASLADPGTPIQGTVALTATASSERGIADVTFQRAPAGGGSWTTICTAASAPYSCTFDSTAVTDGAYDLRALATDAGGYTRTAVVGSRTVDNVGPTVTLADPGSFLSGTAGLHVTASDSLGVAAFAIEYRAAGASSWTTLCNTGASPRTCPFNTTTVADGSYELRATATDTGGNTTSTAPITRPVDNTGPATSLGDPGTMRQTVTLTAAASDGPGTGVASVAIQYRTSPSGTWTTACTRASAPYSCSLDTTTSADGLYDLRSIATDSAGNATASAVLSARRVDNTAPTSAVANPGTPLRGTVTVSGTATDAGSGVAGWTLQRRPSAGGAWTTVCTDASPPFSCAWDTTGVADGLYDLQAVTTDVAGNATASTAVAGRRVDNTAPAVALTDPGSPKTGTFTLAATGTDSGSGVASVVFQRRATGTTTWTTLCTDNAAPYTCSYDSTAVVDNAYDFQAVATDVAGNTASSVVGARVTNNTTPTPADVSADNGTGTAGIVEPGDTIAFDFNEPLQPASVMTGWNGSAGAAVTVRVLDAAGNDNFEIWNAANTTQTRLTSGGPVGAKKLVSANITFNATIAQPTPGAYVITLGTIRSGSAASATAASTANLSWPAAAGFLDLAGTASVAKTVTGTKTTPF